MAESEAPKRRLAVLIDGDNISHAVMQPVLVEAANHGEVFIKRVYGDWGQSEMQGWREVNKTQAFSQRQQARINGKKTTDIALAIDAMEILFTEEMDGFVLVSSDSDYTALAIKLREKGRFVLGIGKQSTDPMLQSACSLFRHLENLTTTEPERAKKPSAKKASAAPPPAPVAAPGEMTLEAMLLAAYEASASRSEDEWVFLGAIGDQLNVLFPGFDPRTYKKRQLWQLVQESGLFDHRRKGDAETGPIYVKLKGKK